MLTAGQVHDIHGGRALLASVPPMRRLVADEAYDANDLRDFLVTQGTEPVISPNPRRKVRPTFDAQAYKARNLIERALLPTERLAGHCDPLRQTARNFLAGICLAVAVIS